MSPGRGIYRPVGTLELDTMDELKVREAHFARGDRDEADSRRMRLWSAMPPKCRRTKPCFQRTGSRVIAWQKVRKFKYIHHVLMLLPSPPPRGAVSLKSLKSFLIAAWAKQHGGYNQRRSEGKKL